jgi:hypothetical protein
MSDRKDRLDVEWEIYFHELLPEEGPVMDDSGKYIGPCLSGSEPDFELEGAITRMIKDEQLLRKFLKEGE